MCIRDRNSSSTLTVFDQIKEGVSPFFIRIKKSDLSLPPAKFNKILLQMNPLQEQIYKVIAIKYLSELVKDREERVSLREWRRAKIIRLLQIATNPTLLTRYSEEFKIPPLSLKEKSLSNAIRKYSDVEIPCKFEKLCELVSKIVSSGRKVIIWTYFVHNIKMIEKYLRKFHPLIVFGGIPKTEQENEQYNRERIISTFKKDPTRLALIANPPACGESISLHKVCHDAIYVDRTFNCGHYLQSLDRIHRLGLHRNVNTNYYILMCKNSIDEVVDQRLALKKRNMEYLINEDLPILKMDLLDNGISDNLKEENEDFKAVIYHLRKIK